jgi:hypothetical protein
MTKRARSHLVALVVGVVLAGRAHGGPEDGAHLKFTPDFGDVTHLGVLQDDAMSAEAPPLPPADDGWDFRVAPFLWMSSIDADLTAKGVTVGVDVDFSDIFGDLNFGGMLLVEAVRDRWRFKANGMYISLSTDTSFDRPEDAQREFAFAGDIQEQVLGRIVDIPVGVDVAVGISTDLIADISVNMDIAILELFAGYELFSFPIGDLKDPYTQRAAALTISPYGGGRLNYLDIETNIWLSASADVNVDVDVELGPDDVDPSVAEGRSANAKFELDDDSFWVDPVIGLEIGLVNLDRWNFNVRGDVGGFGLGSASELVWSLGGNATYQVNPRFSVWGGYFLLDYDKGIFDGRLEGPILGGAFTF